MHSIAIASLLAAAATLSCAAPTSGPNSDPTVCAPGTGFFQVCAKNGFRGCCRTDACSGSWCPDYKTGTYTPAHAWEGRSDPTVCAPGTGYYQVCGSSNGLIKFKGCCKTDACSKGYCPDTVTHPAPVEVVKPPVVASSDPTVCAPGTGFFQKCSNGFQGCCKSDACGPAGWCPDYKFGTYTPAPTVKRAPAPASDPTVCAPGTGFFQKCSNGFQGCCKGDACGPAGWCPDYKFGTYTPAPTVKRAPAPASDPTVCAPGTGFFQNCANGFKGCCRTDACSTGYCADTGSAPAPVEVVKPPVIAASDPTVCAPGTGYYQVCSSGFKGCCQKDACSLGYCPF